MTKPSSSQLGPTTAKPLVANSKGLIVPLGEPIGFGGEGRVYEVLKQPNIAAKVYHKAPLPEAQIEKLRAMISLDAKALAPISAWPQDLLIDARRKQPCGILMTRVNEAKELHELYGAAPRARHFPHAYWHHLVLAARNAAAAFEAMHARGVVVGDVNQGNLLVDTEMCVRFIDCDSFQITAGGKRFSCPVGTPHFTPPELQAMRLADVERTTQHDAFGLALLVFHLLFVGRHPFAGRYHGEGDMPIERAIGERRFAFSRHTDQTQMTAPPSSLTMDDVTPTIARMFESALRLDPRSTDSRPTPREWVVALEEMLKNRKQCNIDPAHVFFNISGDCPWCRIETAGGPSFFVDHALTGGSMQSRLEAYDRCLRQVEAIYFPDLARKTLAVPSIPPLKKSKEAPPMRAPDWLAIGSAASAALCVGGAFFWPVLVAGAVGSFACAAGLAWGKLAKIRRAGEENFQRQIELLTEKVEDAGDAVMERHREREQQFDTFSAVVNSGRERFSADDDSMEAVVGQLRAEQRDDHLRSLEIRNHRRKIPGLKRGHIAILQSYGVETALECEDHLLAAIPSIPPKIVIELLSWRGRKADEYAYNPEGGITERELEIDRQEAAARFKISQARKVLNGVTRLRSMAHQGRVALQKDLASIEKLQQRFRDLAREYQDFEATRSPLERLLNQNQWTLLAAALAAPAVGTLLWTFL